MQVNCGKNLKKRKKMSKKIEDWAKEAPKQTIWIKGIIEQGFLALQTVTIGKIKYLIIPEDIQIHKVNDSMFIIQERETFEAKVEQAVKEYAYEHRNENSTGSFNVPEVTSKIISKFKGVL